MGFRWRVCPSTVSRFAGSLVVELRCACVIDDAVLKALGLLSMLLGMLSGPGLHHLRKLVLLC